MKVLLSIVLSLLLGSNYASLSKTNDEFTVIYDELSQTVSSFWADASNNVTESDVIAGFESLTTATVYGTPRTYLYLNGAFLEVENGQAPSGIQITVTTEDISATLAEVSALSYACTDILVHGGRSAIEFYIGLGVNDK